MDALLVCYRRHPIPQNYHSCSYEKENFHKLVVMIRKFSQIVCAVWYKFHSFKKTFTDMSQTLKLVKAFSIIKTVPCYITIMPYIIITSCTLPHYPSDWRLPYRELPSPSPRDDEPLLNSSHSLDR